jgi:hypothetical protein
MNIYSIKVKDYNENFENNQYSRFIVLGETINDMLENLYKELCPEKEDIPYYLRSSNFTITCLGDFTPNEKIKIENKILCSRYENWND